LPPLHSPGGFAFGDQGLCPWTPPEEALPPLDSSAKGVFDPSGLPFRGGLTWAERRVTDAPHDRTFGEHTVAALLGGGYDGNGYPTYKIRLET